MTQRQELDDGPLLTPVEAARELKISQSTLNRYQKQGFIIPFRTPSGRRRFRRADVRALLHRAAS